MSSACDVEHTDLLILGVENTLIGLMKDSVALSSGVLIDL